MSDDGSDDGISDDAGGRNDGGGTGGGGNMPLAGKTGFFRGDAIGSAAVGVVPAADAAPSSVSSTPSGCCAAGGC